MKIKTTVILDSQECESKLQYKLVVESIAGSQWRTGRISNAKSKYFTPSELSLIPKIYITARKWYFEQGVPQEVTLEHKTFNTWIKLVNFCIENLVLCKEDK